MGRPSVRLLLTLALVMAISGMAGAFAAGGRFKADVRPDQPSTCVVTDDPASCDEAETDDEGKGAKDAETTPEERAAACTEAAGLEDPEAEPVEGADEHLPGLERAIERVHANCLKNPDAPGLLNALEHLRANAERKAAHDAEREARAAERAADKAAREAEKAAKAAERAADKAERAADKAERTGGNGHGNPHD